jgi:hypothetical protein
MAGVRDLKETSTTNNTHTNLSQDNPPGASPSPEEPGSEKSHRWLAWAYKGWLLLLAHTICSIAISLSIALALNGYNAIDTSTPRYFDHKLHLRVSDVTTLVSVGLVINRFFTTAWTAVAIWNSTFILTHNTTPKLDPPRLVFMQKYKLPPWARYRFQLPRGSSSWIILSILLCILPQQFIAPLISGAINWNPVSVLGSARISVNSSNPAAAANLFEQYTNYADTAVALRQQVLAKAQGLASQAWSDSSSLLGNGTSLTGNGCRHVVNNDGLTTNSTLLDSIVPCIRIHNIDWDTSEISSSVRNDSLSYYVLDLLSEVNVRLDRHSNVGQLMLFNPNLLWDASSYPVSTLVSGPQTLAISIASENTSTTNCTGGLPIDIFGNVNYVPQPLYWSLYKCFAFANVTITAGVTKSAVSTYVLSTVVEDQTPIDQVIFEPNLWVQEALWLLPDLLSQLSFANSSQIPTWDNLEGYIENIIRQAYLGAWDAFHQTFDELNSTTSTAIPAVSRIQASISNARVFAWLGVSLLILVGGLLLVALPFSIPKPDREAMEEIMKDGNDDGIEILGNIAGLL